MEDLTTAGLEVEAGLELVRGESALMSRLGKDRALAVLFDRYPRGAAVAPRLPAGREPRRRRPGLGARGATPACSGRRSYPRAFAELVDKYGPAEGNPPWFLLSIIRKESGFLPTEVSYADARGLVQVLPETGARSWPPS